MSTFEALNTVCLLRCQRDVRPPIQMKQGLGLFEMRRENKCPFLLATVILGFLSIFNKSQASSPFEALNSTCLSRCQTDVRPPVQVRRETRAFFRESTGVGFFNRVSIGDSDIPSYCEMKEQPAFKPLQGIPAFFQVSASRGPFHLRQQTQGPSHIPIPEGNLLLRHVWKVGLLLQSKPGIQLSSGDHLGCTVVS